MALPEKNGKRKRKNYYKFCTKKPKRGILEVGVRGILITCNGYERKCINEAYNLLNEYADTLYGPEFKTSDETSSNMSIEDQLEQELNELKSKKKGRRFQQVCTKVKNIIFVQTTIPNVSRLISTIFEDIKNTGERKTRYIMKMTPVEATCKCFPEDIRKSVTEVITEEYPNNEMTLSYKVQCKIRHNTGIDSTDLIWYSREAISKIKPEWKATLDDPDIILSMDILQSVCCIGILKNYDSFKKYNLAEMVSISQTAIKKKVTEVGCSQIVKSEAENSSVKDELSECNSKSTTETEINIHQEASNMQKDDENIEKVDSNEDDIDIFSPS